MKEINWARKLTSRKFWVAVVSLVGDMIVMFGGTEDTVVKVTALIMSGAAVIAYIIGEGLVDAQNVESEEIYLVEEKPPLEEGEEE